jgi:hypothetical protein
MLHQLSLKQADLPVGFGVITAVVLNSISSGRPTYGFLKFTFQAVFYYIYMTSGIVVAEHTDLTHKYLNNTA